MLFWICVAIIVLGCAISVFDSYSPGLMVAAWIFIGSCVSFLVLFFCAAYIPYEVDYRSEVKHNLRSIGAGTGVEGRSYFLGGGYINGERVLNYITLRDGGANRVEMADADVSVVYEDQPAGSGTVTVRHFEHVNGWILPWALGGHLEYEFHVPAGSVSTEYQVNN